MPLSAAYAMSVFLLTAPSGDGRRAIGTAFSVGMSSELLPHFYFVTAKHVVEDVPDVAVRLRKIDGSVVDKPLESDDWVHHLSADVSAMPMPNLGWTKDFGWAPLASFVEEPVEGAVLLGEDVFFVGLLRKLPVMEEAGVPMVRSGTIGRLNQPGLKAIRDDGISRKEYVIEGHLIDCRAYQGMSGAPCWVQRPIVRQEHNTYTNEPVSLKTETHLFGLISAHFDETIQADIDEGGAYPVHTGVGVVTPARFINELLTQDEDLVAERKQRDDEKRARDEADAEELAGTPDNTAEC
jgi:hypothetical protein